MHCKRLPSCKSDRSGRQTNRRRSQASYRAGGDARLIACRMVRNNRKGRGSHERASPTKCGKNIVVACWATNDSVFGRAVFSRTLWDVILEGAGYGEGRGKAHAT